MNIRPKIGAALAFLALLATTAQAAFNVLYVASSNDAAYQTWFETRYPGSVWVQKATGTTTADTVGGDLDRFADYTGTNGGTGLKLRDYLQTFDLIIVGIPTTSGNYADGANGGDWAALTKPVLIHSAAAARATGGRLGMFSGDNLVTAFAYGNPTDTLRVATNALSDALLAGTTTPTDLYGFTSSDTINGVATFGSGQRITSLTNGTTNHHGLFYWPAGATNAVGSTMSSNRGYLPFKGNINDLTTDGKIVLGNLIDQLTTPVTTPVFPAPTGLTATSGLGQVSLSWTAVSGATSYNVKRSTAAGSGYVAVSTAGAVTGTTYTDTAVVNGTTYYYVVSAVGTTESENSAEASATPVAFIYPAKKILYVSSSNSTAYQSFATTGQFANNTWTQKPGGLTGDDTVGGDLDRVANFTGTNAATGITVRAYLQSFDLIIVGVPNTSANFNDDALGADWAALTKPVLVHAATIARASTGGAARMGLFSGDNFITFTHGNPADSERASTSALSDAILAGVTDLTNLYGANQSDTINTIAAYGNGELMTRLTDGTAHHHGVVFWAAGATSPLAYSIASNRAYMPLKAGITDLTTDGQKVLANLIVQLGVTQAVPPPLLTAPGGLGATAETNGTITLSWTAGIGASTYSIKRSTTSGSGYTTISAGAVTGTTFSDTTVVGGTTYYYVVSAVSTTPAESANSNEATATAVTVATPLQTWRTGKFGNANNSGDGADSADPDQDGRANLVEYATGTDPLVADSGPAVTLGQAAGKLAVTFTRIADPALVYTVRGSDDLTAAWSATPVFTSTGSANTAGPVTVEDNVLISAQPRRFLRLEISY